MEVRTSWLVSFVVSLAICGAAQARLTADLDGVLIQKQGPTTVEEGEERPAGSEIARSAPSTLLDRATKKTKGHSVTDSTEQSKGQDEAIQKRPAFPGEHCARHVPLDASSIWAPGYARSWHSCSPGRDGLFARDAAVRTDSARMCVAATGEPDHTSLLVDMGELGDGSGCFAWIADQCSIDLRRVSQLSFDIDMQHCENLWTAPLWISPLLWRAPQGLSGEVDFVEQCPVSQVSTNLGCWSLTGTAREGCVDGQTTTWGRHGDLWGPKHVVMTLHDSGNVTAPGRLDVHVCAPGGRDCHLAASKPDYLSAAWPTQGQPSSWPTELRSTVWNGFPTPEDGGWRACRAVHDPHTKCRFVLSKIQVASNDGVPLFVGKCAALNANTA